MVSACTINPPATLQEQCLLILKVPDILEVGLIWMNLLLVFLWDDE